MKSNLPAGAPGRARIVTAPITLFAGMLGVVAPAHAQFITPVQTDTFELGTTAGWANGGNPGAPPLVLAAGGPLGPADHFLEITSDGLSAGGKLTVFNRAQWTGDYNAAGVTEIDLDLKGFSSPNSDPLSIRLSLKSGTFSTSPGYVSTTAFSLVLDGQWHHATFDLSAMTPVGSPPPLAALLDAAPELRIIDAPAPDTVHGINIAAQIGVDNITAVPEPSSSLMAALLLALSAVWARMVRFDPVNRRMRREARPGRAV